LSLSSIGENIAGSREVSALQWRKTAFQGLGLSDGLEHGFTKKLRWGRKDERIFSRDLKPITVEQGVAAVIWVPVVLWCRSQSETDDRAD
jgi:hypothetical protein